MENTNKVERSELWNDIYGIVKQIPRKEVDGDAVDAPSATTSIENLIEKYKIKSVENNNQLAEMFLEEHFSTKPDIDNPYKLYWKEDVIEAMVRFLDANT